MTLQEKLDLWVKITGVNPSEDKKKYTIYLDGRLSEYDIKRMNDRIMETLQDDETGMFAEAYLSSYLKQFLEKKNISLLEIISNKELSAFIDDIKLLYNGLKETDAESLILNEAKKAMEFYNLPFNLEPIDVVELRTSALRCMNGKLKLLQFSMGNNKADDFKLSKDIYMFNNLDALILCSAKGNLNGVTLGYIRDKDMLTSSYFAFIIKNGDNLYILTDMPKYAHPAQKGMTRCSGRDMSNRIEANWFPYETVANIDISDLWDSGRYGTTEIKKELSNVVNEDIPYAVIGKIESLNEYEAFWFIMMVSLIKDKFYEKDLPQLPISYTRSMINSTLIEKTENALIVQNSLPSFELEEIKDIKETDGLEYERKNEEYIGHFDYLVDRYKDKIDKSLLNVVSNTDNSRLIEDKYMQRDSWGREIGCSMRSVDLDNVAGTKEEIEYNLKWIARYNFAKAIQDEIKKDVAEKYNMLYETIENYITPRLEEIIKMHLRNELVGYKVKSHGFEVRQTEEKVNISKVAEFNKWYESNNWGRYHYGIPKYANKSDIKCYFTNTQAGVVIDIFPETAKELALVCGISVDELPEELRHYNKKERIYTGNSILTNIDPYLTILSDDFDTLSFGITIVLSKKKYLEFCNMAGVEAVKFWEVEHPMCFLPIKFDDNKYWDEVLQHKKPQIKEEEDKCKGKYQTRWNGKIFEKSIAKKCLKCKWYIKHKTKEETE